MYILPILLLCTAAGARELLQRLGWRGGAAAAGRAWLRAGPGGPGGLPRRRPGVNQHELASNEGCTQTCCGRACWNGPGTASNPASWNGYSRNINKYAKNMQLYVKICFKYANI